MDLQLLCVIHSSLFVGERFILVVRSLFHHCVTEARSRHGKETIEHYSEILDLELDAISGLHFEFELANCLGTRKVNYGGD